MKKILLMMSVILLFASCAKEEFATNKGNQSINTNSALSTSNKLCSQSTLISPKVDILMLWDNSSSFNFVTSATKNSMSNLISSVSENFDYHVLSLPLVPASTTPLYEGQLIVKNNEGITGNALNIVKSKESAIASLSFSPGNGSAERGVDRAIEVIENNRTNGIFRKDAYTMIVILSNEDDKGCGLISPTNPQGFICNNDYDYTNYLEPKIKKLLCLRGNTAVDCSSTGITQASSLNSSMMRFINISPLTKCTNGLNKVNYLYRKVAKSLYEASYTNGWPTSNDHLSPDVTGAPDSYDLCKTDFGHIFDGVNAAIKQTLLKHKYDYWPVAGSDTPLDPETLRVVRSDGKILTNRTGDSNPADGFQYVDNKTNQPTRFYPTAGEEFTGKMIQLFGTDGNDKVVYPDCLTITFNEPKKTYGYIQLNNGTPKVETLEVYLNKVKVPQSATNGWQYIGLKTTSALDPDLQIVGNKGEPSGLFIELSGSYKVQNTSSNSFEVYYTSTATN